MSDALQAFEEIPGVNLDETVDADIPDIGGFAVAAIANVAMLLNILTAWAIVPLVAYLNSNKLPFPTRRFETRSDR